MSQSLLLWRLYCHLHCAFMELTSMSLHYTFSDLCWKLRTKIISWKKNNQAQADLILVLQVWMINLEIKLWFFSYMICLTLGGACGKNSIMRGNNKLILFPFCFLQKSGFWTVFWIIKQHLKRCSYLFNSMIFLFF